MIIVDNERCLLCGGCISVCPVNANEFTGSDILIDEEKCTQCGSCLSVCPVSALSFGE